MTIPYIKGLGAMDAAQLKQALTEGQARGEVAVVDWPEEYPYKPECEFLIGHDGQNLAIWFNVCGLDLRASGTEDGTHVWEDSCCEFFVEDPSDGSYCNFEMNCVGALYNCKGPDRSNRTLRSPEQMARVKRFSSLPAQTVEIANEEFFWSVAMVIPFDLMGMEGNLPEKIRANFYKCGDLTAHPHFLSWNRVGTPTPDFHRPEFFGELNLEMPR